MKRVESNAEILVSERKPAANVSAEIITNVFHGRKLPTDLEDRLHALVTAALEEERTGPKEATREVIAKARWALQAREVLERIEDNYPNEAAGKDAAEILVCFPRGEKS